MIAHGVMTGALDDSIKPMAQETLGIVGDRFPGAADRSRRTRMAGISTPGSPLASSVAKTCRAIAPWPIRPSLIDPPAVTWHLGAARS
jgi:hypothetical protein